MFSYIAPTSPDAETFSKMLDNQTVMSGLFHKSKTAFQTITTQIPLLTI